MYMSVMLFSFIELSLIAVIDANPISPTILQARQAANPFLIWEGFYLLVTSLQGGSDALRILPLPWLLHSKEMQAYHLFVNPPNSETATN
jgi:hypothetical protein